LGAIFKRDCQDCDKTAIHGCSWATRVKREGFAVNLACPIQPKKKDGSRDVKDFLALLGVGARVRSYRLYRTLTVKLLVELGSRNLARTGKSCRAL
ncbi:hypothetical protein T310_8664, partial [Rasamsonia emersonii CBS 393.64]